MLQATPTCLLSTSLTGWSDLLLIAMAFAEGTLLDIATFSNSAMHRRIAGVAAALLMLLAIGLLAS